MKEFLLNLKRCSVELCIVLLVITILFSMPISLLDPGNINPKLAIASTFLIAAFRVSMGFLSGHIARKMFFPYISFREEKEWSNNVIIIAFYVLGIYAWVNAG